MSTEFLPYTVTLSLFSSLSRCISDQLIYSCQGKLIFQKECRPFAARSGGTCIFISLTFWFIIERYTFLFLTVFFCLCESRSLSYSFSLFTLSSISLLLSLAALVSSQFIMLPFESFLSFHSFLSFSLLILFCLPFYFTPPPFSFSLSVFFVCLAFSLPV